MIKFSEHLVIWFFVFCYFLTSFLVGFNVVMDFLYPEEVYAVDVMFTVLAFMVMNFILLAIYDEWKEKVKE